MNTPTNIQVYGSEFEETTFWDKVKKVARKVGYEGLEKALWLYYALQKPDLPAWAKATIVGALGYFVFPMDAIPDILPGIGYTDDIAVMAAAIAAVATHIDDEVKHKAQEKLETWFG